MIKYTLKKFTLGVGLLALAAALSTSAFAQNSAYVTETGPGQTPLFVVGHNLIAGPAIPATSFSGIITNTVVGSLTTSVLTYFPVAGTTPATLLIGSIITGAGVTAGTTISGFLGGGASTGYNYSVIGSSNTVAAVSTPVTMTATPVFTSNAQDSLQGTAPTYASGGCTTTAAFIANADGTTSGPFRWTFKQGASGCGSNSTVTLTFPAATTSWMCGAISDITTPSHDIVSTGAASTTAVVLTDYSGAGVAQTMLANDVYTGACSPR